VIVDAFAGPGGWSEGLRLLGHRELGIELDPVACATARAAGHERLEADVAALDPSDFIPCTGFIASPPCPSFSNAGNGRARDVDLVIACARDLAAGHDSRAEYRERCEDERSILSVEPLRWALAVEPEWIALEQVPAVLPIWQVLAEILRERGYSVWTGVLEAERYGVPQTRERAILMARRSGVVHPPEPTHQRYVPGEPQRHDVTMFGEVLPWVSMAQALGWGATARPYPTVACSSTTGGPDIEKVGGSGARAQLYEEQAAGRWAVQTNNFSAVARDSDGGRSAAGSVRYERSCDAPSRVFQPGGHHANDGRVSNAEDDGRSRNAIRVSIEEAAVLQSFRPDYPWQGNKSETFRQVGNAVPPLLARAILAGLVGEPLEAAA